MQVPKYDILKHSCSTTTTSCVCVCVSLLSESTVRLHNITASPNTPSVKYKCRALGYQGILYSVVFICYSYSC